MSKEARALLKKINDKKNAIKSLVNEGKTKEAKEAKAELVDMQDRFNILMDLEDDEDEDIKDQIDKDEATKAEGKDKAPSKKDIARAFVNRIVCGMRKTKLNEKDQKIMDAMSEKSDEDGGFTVPQDIQTEVGVCGSAKAPNGALWYYIYIDGAKGKKYGYVNARYITAK